MNPMQGIAQIGGGLGNLKEYADMQMQAQANKQPLTILQRLTSLRERLNQLCGIHYKYETLVGVVQSISGGQSGNSPKETSESINTLVRDIEQLLGSLEDSTSRITNTLA